MALKRQHTAKSGSITAPQVEELEARLLLSADPVGAFVPDNFSADPVAIEYLLDENLDAVAPWSAVQDTDDERLELVFVDTDTPEYQQLIDDLLTERNDGRRIDVYVLDNDRDGITQISETLATLGAVDAIHIISHGVDGSLDLGSTQLSNDNLTDYQRALQGWAAHLDADADILIYGCNLAASADGQNLINQIANLTSADIAASDDVTGHAILGGDWKLEHATGSIEAEVAVSISAQQQWTEALVAPTAADDSYSINEDSSLNVNWWHSDWTARRTLTLDNSAQGENLVDFPVLVVLDPTPVTGNIDYAKTQNDGADLRFFAADGTALDYDIEEWNEGGFSSVWVKVPLITAGSSTDSITMYYGNAGAPAGENAEAVWSNGFAAVQHLNDDLLDESANNNDGVNSGSTNAPGQVADGQLFDGTDDYVNLGSDASIDDVFAGGGTVSAWINPSSWGENGYGRIFDKSDSTLPNAGWALEMAQGTSSLLFQQGFSGSIGSWASANNSISVGPNAWQLVTVSYDSSSPGNTPSFYVNGVSVATVVDATPTGTAVGDGAIDLHLGNFAQGTVRTFDGTIDDVRMSSEIRSADWIRAQYLSTSNSFVNFIPGEETAPLESGVLGNDSDLDNDAQTVSLVSGPSDAASFTLAKNGTFSYTPNADFNGVDSFTYVTNDGTADSNVATATITVNAVNDAPIDLVVTSTDAGGLELNAGGGNDTYFVSDNGSALLGGLTQITIEATFSVDTPATDNTVLLSYASGSNDEELALFIKPDGRIWLHTHSNGSTGRMSAASYPQLLDGQVHHVAASWDAADGAVEFYVDGVAVESFTGYQTLQTIAGAGQLVFGQDQDTVLGGWNTIDVFSGTLYDVRIFNDVRTSSEITDNFDQTLAPTEPGMIANWIFNDFAGGVVTDTVSGNNLTEQHVVGAGFSANSPELTLSVSEHAINGAMIGSVTAVDPDSGDTFTYSLTDTAGGRFAINSSGQIFLANASLVDFETNTSHDITVRVEDSGALTYDEVFTITVIDVSESGPPGNSLPLAQDDRVGLSFDGVDDYISIDNDPSLVMTNNFTMEAWVNLNTTATGGSQIIINKEGEYEIGVTASTGEIKWAIAEGATWAWRDTGIFLTKGEWTHLAVTYDAGTVNTYVNGTLVHTFSQTGPVGEVYAGFNKLYLGGRENAADQRFDGDIDEVRLWSVTRTQSEIDAAKDTPINNPALDATLVGYWQLDQGTGNQAPDYSSYGNDGTLGGADGPMAQPDWSGYIVDEDTLLTVSVADGVLANDVDPDGDPMTVTNVNTTGVLGVLVMAADGSFTYDPRDAFDSLKSGEHATETFTYTANDGNGDSNTATATITVIGYNDAPQAVTDAAVTDEGTPVNIDVLDNDTDAQGDPMFVIDVGNAGNGTVVNNGDGTVTYTPDGGFTGADSFNYLVSDLYGLTSYWALAGDATDSVGGNNGTITGTTTVAGAIGDALSFDKVDDRVVVPNFSINDSFSLSFQIKVDDNSGADYQYIYSHGPVNNANSLNIFIGETGSGYANMLYTQFNDSNDIDDRTALEFDVGSIIGDGEWHTYTLTVETGSGSAVYLDGTLQNTDARGGDSFTPTTDIYFGGREDLNSNRFFGGSLDSVQIFDRALDASEVSDVHTGGTSLGAVNVTVKNVPVASDDSGAGFSTTEDVTSFVTGNVLTNDDLGDLPASVSTFDTSSTNSGTVSYNGDGTFTYTPDTDFNGSDSFTYTISDADSETSTATVTISVTAVNDAPTITSTAGTTATEDTLYTYTATVSDPDDANNGTDLTWSLSGAPAGMVVSSTGVVTWTPAEGVTTSGSVTLTVSDGNEDGAVDDTEVFTITVTPVNAGPTITSTAGTSATEDSLYTYTATVSDPDDANNGTDLTWSLSGAPTGMVVSSTGVVTWTPAEGVTTSGSVTLTVSDGNEGGAVDATEVFTITVTPVNDAPTGSVTIDSVTPKQGDLLTASNDLSDADGIGTITYQWLRDGALLAGQTSDQYALTQTDVGASISVIASYLDNSDTHESVSSAVIGPVLNRNDLPIGAPVITGISAVGETLTAVTSSIADLDGLGDFNYDWQRSSDGGLSWEALGSGDSYTLVESDSGAEIRVNVSYIDGYATLESLFSYTLVLPGTKPIEPNEESIVPTDSAPPESRIDHSDFVEEPILSNIPSDNSDGSDGSDGSGGNVPAANKEEASRIAEREDKRIAGSTRTLLPVQSLPNAGMELIEAAPQAAGNFAEEPTREQAISAEPQTRAITRTELDRVVMSSSSTPSSNAELRHVEAVLNNPSMWQGIEAMKREMDKSDSAQDPLVVEVVSTTGVGLMAGLVAYGLRGGALMASLMSTMPLWQAYDPLPILSAKRKDPKRSGTAEAADSEAEQSSKIDILFE